MSNYLGIDELTLQQWEEISIAHRVTCLEMKDHRGGGSKIAGKHMRLFASILHSNSSR